MTVSGQHTHASLCSLAARWLRFTNTRGGHGCQVALSEPRTGYLAGEIPDAIGFRVAEPGTGSVVVECKVSRADFLADAKKPHRSAAGMGLYRYYLCPEGVIEPGDVPERWGLLTVNKRGTVRALCGAVAVLPHHSGAPYYPDDFGAVLREWEHARDAVRETLLLTSILSRVGDVEAANLRIRVADARYAALVKRFEKQREQISRLQQHIALGETPSAAAALTGQSWPLASS